MPDEYAGMRQSAAAKSKPRFVIILKGKVLSDIIKQVPVKAQYLLEWDLTYSTTSSALQNAMLTQVSAQP